MFAYFFGTESHFQEAIFTELEPLSRCGSCDSTEMLFGN
ncbi:hypothetical protein VS84_02184 [Vibrio cholerae]|nr:hypothetical protein VS84_02184 [Vibrio cholerae]KKP20995.1 hypothetical protein VS86_01486 [Vibrio cholerae]